jgi:hypothetical protein
MTPIYHADGGGKIEWVARVGSQLWFFREWRAVGTILHHP